MLREGETGYEGEAWRRRRRRGGRGRGRGRGVERRLSRRARSGLQRPAPCRRWSLQRPCSTMLPRRAPRAWRPSGSVWDSQIGRSARRRPPARLPPDEDFDGRAGDPGVPDRRATGWWSVGPPPGRWSRRAGMPRRSIASASAVAVGARAGSTGIGTSAPGPTHQPPGRHRRPWHRGRTVAYGGRRLSGCDRGSAKAAATAEADRPVRTDRPTGRGWPRSGEHGGAKLRTAEVEPERGPQLRGQEPRTGTRDQVHPAEPPSARRPPTEGAAARGGHGRRRRGERRSPKAVGGLGPVVGRFGHRSGAGAATGEP